MTQSTVLLIALIGQVNANDSFVVGIKTAYEANRNALSYGTSQFTFSAGKTTAHGFYAFDGADVRYELLVSTEDFLTSRVKTGPNAWSYGPVRSYRILSDGQSTLFDRHSPNEDGSLLYAAQIEAGNDQFSRNLLFPLDLGNPTLGDWHVSKDIEFVQKGVGERRLHSVDEHAKLDGVDVVLLTFTDKGFRRQYWLDMAKSAVPLRVLDTADAGGRIQVDYRDIRWVSNKGWLPFRYTIQLGGAPPKELVVESADFETRPPRSTFRLEFPEPINMVDVGRKIVYQPKKVWDLSDLAGRNSAEAKHIDIQDSQPAVPQHPGEIQSRSRWIIPLTVLGVAILGLSGILIWRRRHAT